jgi:hypothetical protein
MTEAVRKAENVWKDSGDMTAPGDLSTAGKLAYV